MSLLESLRDHIAWQTDVIQRCDDWLTDVDPENRAELRAAFMARKTHAENTRDRLSAILQAAGA